jgi:UDPglucose 6-dehydrogenase
MNITVIGTGYVGLVTGACFSKLGFNITCLDINRSRVSYLKKGKVPFYEPGLEDIIKRSLKQKKIKFTSSYKTACKEADVFFICVGTPDDGLGNPSMQYIESVAQNLSQHLPSKSVAIFIKSTVPVGTNNLFKTLLATYGSASIEGRLDISVHVASNPEFLKEGAAVDDFMKPDRIIIGTDTQYIKDISRQLYSQLNRRSDKLKFMSIASAELTKYAANSFLATKISFMNEVANLCEKVGADIDEIRAGIGSDDRIGQKFLYAGLGYGGSCFPKDVQALRGIFEKHKVSSSIVTATHEVNKAQFMIFVNKIIAKLSLQGALSKKSIHVWGLSFKPDTDDVRESVAIKIVEELASHFKTIFVYDPIATKNAKLELRSQKNIVYCVNKYDYMKNSSALVICTEWKEFWKPDNEKIGLMKNPCIFDGRNVIDHRDLSLDVEYIGIGRDTLFNQPESANGITEK